MNDANDHLASSLQEIGVNISRLEERSFPEEKWVIVFVPEASVLAAQSLAGSLERELNEKFPAPLNESWVVTFRAAAPDSTEAEEPQSKSQLNAKRVDQLIQLLEARSRTSDALPSLKYVEDPRASLAAVAASRHHLIYGRRGVGKTALLLEAKRDAERQGHVAVWFNLHTVRNLDSDYIFTVIAELALGAIARAGGTSEAPVFERISQLASEMALLRNSDNVSALTIRKKLPDINHALRAVLRAGILRMFIYLDDFYLLPIGVQPLVLDALAAMFRDCDGWLKVASIERLTRPFEPSSKVGIEVPHDVSVIDIDVTLEDPGAAQRFLESVLSNYTATAGISKPSTIAKPQALGRLVLGSGGVPRDYMNLFAASIVVARSARDFAREVGKEDVAVAAGNAARVKKRDLEQDVASVNAGELLRSLNAMSGYVKGKASTYFLVDMIQKKSPSYETLGQLVDLRFAHLVQASLSDQHRPGVRYEAYVLDLSEFTDVRLQRGLNVLDLEAGQWSWRLTGRARTVERLSATQLRDKLRQAPVVDLDEIFASTGN